MSQPQHHSRCLSPPTASKRPGRTCPRGCSCFLPVSGHILLAFRAESERRWDADPISDEGREQTCVKAVSHLSHSTSSIKRTLKKCVLRGVARVQGKHSHRCARRGRCLQDSRLGQHHAAALAVYFPSSKLWRRPRRRPQARPRRS